MTSAVKPADHIEALPEDVGVSSRGLENVKRLVQGYVDRGEMSGGLTMVARKGRVVHFETYGKREVEAGLPVEPDTIFRIYSMTKPIASLALMQLYEEARFDLNDPVSKFIPAFEDLQVLEGGTAASPVLRPPSREMTIADVLLHISGLTSHNDEVLGQAYDAIGLNLLPTAPTLADAMAGLAKLPLKCDPGTSWIYSFSTDVVAYLCEVISGQPFDRYLRERVFEPLGMVDTAFHVPESKLERFAACYRMGGALEPPMVLADRPDASSPFGRPRTYFSGWSGLVSTAPDYMRFCKMLLNGGELDGRRVIGKKTVDFMTTNHLPGGRDLIGMHATMPGSEGYGFGLGVAVMMDPAAAGVLGSVGEYYWGGAASTSFFISPKDDLISVFITQLLDSTYPARRQMRAAVYGSLTE